MFSAPSAATAVNLSSRAQADAIMTTLLFAAAVAIKQARATDAEPPNARAEEQAAQIGELSTTQALMELIKVSQAGEVLKARIEEQAAQIDQLTRRIDELRKPKAVALTAAGRQVLEPAQGHARRLSESASCCRWTNSDACGSDMTEKW